MAIEQQKGGRQKPKAEFEDFLKLFPDNVNFETYEDNPDNPVKIEERFQLFIKIEKLTKGLIDLYQQQIKQELGLELDKDDLAVLTNILQEQAVLEPTMIDSMMNNIDRFKVTQRQIKKTEAQIYNQLGFNSFTEGKSAIEAQLEKLDLSVKAQTKKAEKTELAPLIEDISDRDKEIDSLRTVYNKTNHVHEFLLNNVDNDHMLVDSATLKIGLVNSPDFNFNKLSDDELANMVNELNLEVGERSFIVDIKNKKEFKKSSPEFQKFYTEQLVNWELTDEEITQLYNYILRNVWQKFEPDIIAGGIERDNLFKELVEIKKKRKKNKEDKKRLAELAGQINRLDRKNNEFSKFSAKLNDNAQLLITDFLNNKFRFTDADLQAVLEEFLVRFILEAKKTELVKAHALDYFTKADVSKMAMRLPDHVAQDELLKIIAADKQEKYGLQLDKVIYESDYSTAADRNFTYEFREAVLPFELEKQVKVLNEKSRELAEVRTEYDRKKDIMTDAKKEVKTKPVPGREKDKPSRLSRIKNLKIIKKRGWTKYWQHEIDDLSEKLIKAADLEDQRKTLQSELINLRESFLYMPALRLEEVKRRVEYSVLDNINNFDPKIAEFSELEKHAQFIKQQKNVFHWDDLMDIDMDAAGRERLVEDQIYYKVKKEVADIIGKYNFKTGTVDTLEFSIKKFLDKKEIGTLNGSEAKSFVIEKVKEIRGGIYKQWVELVEKEKEAKSKIKELQQKKNAAEADYDATELAYQKQFGTDPNTGKTGQKAQQIDTLEAELTDIDNAVRSMTAQIQYNKEQLQTGLLDNTQENIARQAIFSTSLIRLQQEQIRSSKKKEQDELLKAKKQAETGLTNKKRIVDQLDKQLRAAEMAETKLGRDNASKKSEYILKLQMVNRLLIKIKK